MDEAVLSARTPPICAPSTHARPPPRRAAPKSSPSSYHSPQSPTPEPLAQRPAPTLPGVFPRQRARLRPAAFPAFLDASSRGSTAAACSSYSNRAEDLPCPYRSTESSARIRRKEVRKCPAL